MRVQYEPGSNTSLVTRLLSLLQCFQPIEGTHNNFDNSNCFYHKIVTIGPMVLKCAENVHTSFYSVYASFEEFSFIDSKVTKDQATRNNYPK